MWTAVKQWLQATADVWMPRRCAVCDKVLGDAHEWICPDCLTRMPVTGFHLHDENRMEMLFRGKVLIERATAYFYYRRGDPYANILHDIKYRNMPLMGQWLTERYGNELSQCGWLDDIDAVVPVPLHRRKLAQRGYNQSEYLARGIGRAAGIEVVPALCATRRHETQTRKTAVERHANVADTYAAVADCVTSLEGKHVLIVDDVITTGSTLVACAAALKVALHDIRISILTLASASLE